MKKIFILLVALTTIVSCAKSEFEVQESAQIQNVQTVTVKVMPFVGQDTKSTISTGGSFAWASGDQFGVYPLSTSIGAEQTSQQVMFQVHETSVGSQNGLFTGTGWGLVTGGSYEYFAYYPYNKDAKYNKVNITYPTAYTITSNSSTSHIQEDYLVAPVVTPTEPTDATFAFYHLGSLINFKLLIPEGDRTEFLSFDYMDISCSENVFATEGYYDPTDMTVDVDPAGVTYPEFTATSSTDKIKINLNNIKPDANGYLNIYLMLPSTNLGEKTLNIRLDGNNYKYYTCAKTMSSSAVIQSGKKYTIDFTMEGHNAPVINLSATDSANCYIVNQAGRSYKFSCKAKGNGVVPSGVNDSKFITGYDDVQVTWETVNTNSAPAPGTIVTNVAIDKENGFITFNTPAVFTEGNALISVLNAEDKILWSWHIWATKADLEALAQTYGGADMMDRNLGALSATPGNGLTIGFHYQWGRPFPITGGYSLGSAKDRMATTNSSVWEEVETSEANGTLTYSAQHPTHFIYASASNFYKDDETKVSGNWLWTVKDYATPASMPLFWASTKTMYDPCPIGWKVPAGGNNGVWKTAIFSDTNFIWDSDNKGRTFSSTAYYPAAGFRGKPGTAQGGDLYSTGSSGFYWSSSCKNGDSHYMNFTDAVITTNYATLRVLGLSVRPCKE